VLVKYIDLFVPPKDIWIDVASGGGVVSWDGRIY
jgi:hypothetical protein